MSDCCEDYEGKGKNKYATYEDAIDVARAKREEGINVNVYKCLEGNGYHLTSHGQGDGTETLQQQLVRKFSKKHSQNSGNRVFQKLDDKTVNELKALKESLKNKR